MEADDALAHGLGLGHEEEMIVPRVLVLLALLASTARADETAPKPPDDAVMIRIRELYEQRDYFGVRRELLAAYEEYKHPSLLFALGQVELNLENYQAAIDYYEKFIASGPGDEQIALAQQAIGAARMRISQPKEQPIPPPLPKPRVREWYRSDTIVVAAGGAAVALGTGFVLYGRALGNDRSGSLAAYDDRVDRARAYQYTGVGVAAAGVVAVGVALVRWRLRPHDEVYVSASPTGAAVAWRW